MTKKHNKYLNQIQKDILIGLILGDLHLNNSSKEYRLGFYQSTFHKPYISGRPFIFTV